MTNDAQREGFAKSVKAGVRIANGTDSGIYPHGWNAKNLAFYGRFGLTPTQAHQSATRWAAELLRWEDRVGAVEPGLYADLIAVPGDPSDAVSVLEDGPFVMKGGALGKGRPLAAVWEDGSAKTPGRGRPVTLSADQIVELCKRYTLYDWSAQ